MKKIPFNTAFVGLIILLTLMSCKKETPPNYSNMYLPNSNSIGTGTQSSNTALSISAGQDMWLILPVNYFTVEGGASGNQSGIVNYAWRKISGPASCSILSSGSQFYLLAGKQYLLPKTNFSDLEKGIYKFELTLSNQNSLSVKDTITVTVGELSANPTEKIFNDLTWIFPWNNSVEVKDFNRLITPGIVFKVFIKRDNSAEWQEASPFWENIDGSKKYDYFVETRPDGAGMYHFGSLYISYYGNDVSDTPSVKVLY